VDLLTGDKGDRRCFETILSEREFDVVIDTRPTTEHVRLAFEHFTGRIEHYFMCGSTGTYTPLAYCPGDEDHPWREDTGLNLYWQSKRDAYALALWEEHGFPVTIFRPTNIIGKGRIPLELWGGRNVLYWKLVKESRPVEMPVSGNVLLQSGCNDDLATAFVNAVPKGQELSGEIFIISSKRAITLDRYLSVAKEVLHSRSPVEYLPIEQMCSRRSDAVVERGARFLIEHMCFDISKAEQHLGYAPGFTCEEGLVSALEWCLDEGLL